MPLHWLRSMPLADLQLYQRHSAERGLPGRRLELLLAQVSLVLAQVHGNKQLKLSDFLFDPPPLAPAPEEPTDPEQAAAQVAAFFGYAPRKRKPNPSDNRDTTHGQQPG